MRKVSNIEIIYLHEHNVLNKFYLFYCYKNMTVVTKLRKLPTSQGILKRQVSENDYLSKVELISFVTFSPVGAQIDRLIATH